ncbi:hypothetical protein CAPTEDRAFT_205928 [Capitella teleta]|uniref:GRAM domain-containing protein n=1 Tax=Capitella teleta TaxID=283909 RepID=R7U8A5_CAPTE|nr:hypothetical protein CAPTEDRAFT_205928 [Capitella teleta]|eukprot:ELU02376.1 hypothetical protein CAPTEDRAFT_205928 [Capitella teleta]
MACMNPVSIIRSRRKSDTDSVKKESKKKRRSAPTLLAVNEGMRSGGDPDLRMVHSFNGSLSELGGSLDHRPDPVEMDKLRTIRSMECLLLDSSDAEFPTPKPRRKLKKQKTNTADPPASTRSESPVSNTRIPTPDPAGSSTESAIPPISDENSSQHAKTAPPSPELLHAPKEEELARHSESTSLLEMSTGSLTSSAGKRTSSSTALDNGGGVKPSPPSRRGSTSPTGSTCPSPASTPGLASEHKGLDTHGSSSKLPSPASSPPDTASHYNQKSTKTRHTLKFQRLFRNIEQVPQDEQVVKQFSCAYFGDILLQGYLYITPNFFCFYARILGHEKQIVIPINTVVNLTRERTAFIIPNAIGIVTNEDKFVFGSLMSRDNTFRTMWNVWKAVMSKGEGHHLLDNRVNLLVGPDTLDNNNSLKSKEEGSLGYSDSSVSEASICPECSNPMTEHDPDGKCCPLSPGDADGEMDEEAEDPSTSPSSIEATKLLHAPQRRCFSGLHKGPSLKSLHRSLRSVVRLPKNNYLLALCSMLDQMFSDVYYLNSQHHSSTVQRFHSIIEANIQLLSQVHESLRILHESLNSFAECKRPASTIP